MPKPLETYDSLTHRCVEYLCGNGGESAMYLVKRHQTYWALHDVPRSLQNKLGRRFAKSLGTDDKAEAERRGSLLWLHDWSRKLKGETIRSDDSDGNFFRDLMKSAKTAEEREAIEDHIVSLARDQHDVAVSRGDTAKAESIGRMVDVALGRLVPLSEYLDAWITTLPDAEKTKAMKRAEVEKLAKSYTYVQEIDAKAAAKWLGDTTKTGQLSSKTVGRILSFLRGYWKYLREQGVVLVDPFAGLSPPSTARRRVGWIPFKPSEVVQLRKRASTQGDDELGDLITLGMWTGARIEELCSLEIANVYLKGKSFSVKDAKTKAGIREVPIHSKLLPTMQALIGGRKSGYVLEHLEPNKYGDRSNAIGKRFGRLKKAAGFGEGHVFHSIRKTVVTLLENTGASENVAADVVGHEKPRITYGLYSGGATLAIKRAALSKIRYPA